MLGDTRIANESAKRSRHVAANRATLPNRRMTAIFCRTDGTTSARECIEDVVSETRDVDAILKR